MSQKIKNKKPNISKTDTLKVKTPKNEPWSKAMNFFIAGCLAELYLLLVRHFYMNGTIQQVVAWDGYLKNIAYAGLGILAAGLILGLAFFKKPGWQRAVGWILMGAGAYLTVANWMIRTYYYTAVTFLCAVVPAAMLLGILWLLYDREGAWSLTILGLDIIVLWACRKGLNEEYWHFRVLIGAAVFLAFVAVVALLVWQAEKRGGSLGKICVLPENADPLPIYVACGISAVSMVLGILNTTIAYYTLWVVAVIVFAIAVYYTVKQL